MRKRRLTENIGCYLTVEESLLVRAYVKSQRLTISDYLRQAAVQPLLMTQLAALKDASDGPQD